MIESEKQSAFTFCKMSDNVPFFEYVDSKFAKSVNLINSLIQISMGNKNAELYADSTLVEVGSYKML